jgi:hypothetical protein
MPVYWNRNTKGNQMRTYARHLGAAHLLSLLWVAVHGSVAAAGEPELLQRWDFANVRSADDWRVGNHLKDLSLVGGRLRMTITGPDAFLYAPPVDLPLDGCLIRLKLRSNRGGDTQIYWQTNDCPGYTEARQTTRSIVRSAPPGAPPDALCEFTTIEFPLGGPADAGRRLTGFRIDPFNGNNDGLVEIQSVEVLRMPPVWDVRFSSLAHVCPVGSQVESRLTVRQTGGQAATAVCDVTSPGNQRQQLRAVSTRPAALIAKTPLDRPGVHRLQTKIEAPQANLHYDLVASVVAGQAEQLPVEGSMELERFRLDFLRDVGGKGVSAARWQIPDRQGRWHLAGWLLPLAELTVLQPDGTVVRRQPAMKIMESSDRYSRTILSGDIDDLPGWSVEMKFLRGRDKLPAWFDVTAWLTGPEGGKLLDFSAPVVLADRDAWQKASATRPAGSTDRPDLLDRYGIFGGLEFLEPGWRSSSDRAVGDRFADRWTPHPFKITLPVMAIEAGGVTTALMWQPGSERMVDNIMPAATFASPNFLDDQPNHLMKLSAPTIPRWRNENGLMASTPFNMTAKRLVSLGCSLYAEMGLSAVMTARRWYQVYQIPLPPPSPHDDKATYDLLAEHFGQTMYWPKEKGWRHYWYLDKNSGPVPFMIAELTAHALTTGEKKWVERTGIAGRSIIDTLGPLSSRLSGVHAAAKAAIASMHADGTWLFLNTPKARQQAREFTNGKYDSLGEDNSTSLGTCVQAALPILHAALLTGQDEYVQASVKALNAMRQFRVPRGAQVWEVHKDIPDIRAAALAVEAFHIGAQITGDRSYYDDAAYWAWAGVPFLYSWHVPIEQTPGTVVASHDRDDWNRSALPLHEAFQNPNRQITPFATVPVLGPTFYVVNWFGVVVQWCGLEWAWKVIELDRDSPDWMLRQVADGVVRSGLQQMYDRPPWTGLYPDVWDLQTNRAQGAFICAQLPLACLQAQGHVPPWTKTWTRVVPAYGQRRFWHVSGWGQPAGLAPPNSLASWSVSLDYLPGQPNELIIAGPPRPRAVRLDDKTLEPFAPAKPNRTAVGWRYDEACPAIMLRFIQPAPQAEIQVEW